MYRANLDAHGVELAYHFAEKVTATATQKSLHYSLLAGEQELATYAPEETLAHLERALVVKEAQSVDAETAGLLFGLARAQLAVYPRQRMQEAMDTLNQTFESNMQVGNADRAVAVAKYPLPTGAGILRRAG